MTQKVARSEQSREVQRSGGWRKAPLRRRALLMLSASVVAAAMALALAYWPSVDAQARAVVVLTSVLEAPVATPVVDILTGEPRVEETSVSGTPASIFVPAGGGPHPTLVFANGAIPQGRKFEGVKDLAEGFARAGYLVVVPDLPGLMTYTITTTTRSEMVEVAHETSGRPDVRGGRVGLVGVSTGAALAILAAEDPALAGRVSAVVGVAPYTDIRTVLNVATTAHYELDGRQVPYRTQPFLSYIVTRSLISALPPGEDRSTLLSEMDAAARYGSNPLVELRVRPTKDLGPKARSVVELLTNHDPERFGRLYSNLPAQIRGDLDRLSPMARKERIEAPVELLSGPRDRYFPVSESYGLERAGPGRTLTVTEAIDHSEVHFSLRKLPAFLKLTGFAVRSLSKLRSGA